MYNDVAVLDLQTNAITRLTNVSTNPLAPGGSMHPRFSYDGTKIMWSDFQGGTSQLGDYQIGVGTFTTPGGVPTLTNVTFYNPGPKPEMMESQGFSPDGSKIYFTCTALAGQSDLAADICEYDLASSTLVRVTQTSGLTGEPFAYEEHGARNPLNAAFAFMGSGTYPVQSTNLNLLSWLKTDIWIVDPAISPAPVQVTFFNVPGRPESTTTRMLVSKMGWDPTGTKLVISTWDYKNESLMNDDVVELKIVSLIRR